MPVDEILMRDSCGKSRSKIKKYFYYNEYNKENFPFESDYEELTLLDVIEGSKSISDIIPLFVPYILMIILSLICIGVWISICCCSRKPKCFLKKDNIHTNRTRFICLMVFFGFSLTIIIFGIVLLVYISYAEGDFNGTVCSLLMLQYEIINGQGFLAKKRIYKPYWYGSTYIGTAVENINELLQNLQDSCGTYGEDFQDSSSLAKSAEKALVQGLEKLYTNYKVSQIPITNPTNGPNNIVPIYISNLGPKENNETYTGRIYEGYNKNFKYILEEILSPVTGLCQNIIQDGGQSLTSGLEGFESVINNLNTLLDNLSSKITEYIMDYRNYIINFGYNVNFSLFIIITASSLIECFLYIIYYFRPFSILKYNIYIFINIINLALILCLAYNGIFGILSFLMGNVADIVDAAFSKENLASQEPRLIDSGTDINLLARCLRGDGDLFGEFVSEDVKKITNLLAQLYTLYTPTKKVDERINDETEINEYNSLIALDKVIEELEIMEEDILLTTTKETSYNNDITTMLDEMTKYTMAGRRYQMQCAKATYHIWTTNRNHCPLIQADSNLITGHCMYLNDYDYNGGAEDASSIYNEACPLISRDYFNDVKSAVYQYILSFYEYSEKNKELIKKLLEDEDNPDSGFKNIKAKFKTDFIENVKDSIKKIKEDITSSVHDVFSPLLNDTTEDSSTIDYLNFNLFSWMNCSAIGQDYNATLSTLKTNLTYEMRIITYCSLVCELLLIANLYIMVGLAKNLRDKIFEINDARNVSHSSDNIEELKVNSVKGTKNDKEDDEIFAIKNKKKFEVEQNIDQKQGIDVNEGLDKEGKGITHPAVVSINGPDGRCIFENGENAHKQMEENKNIYNKETEENINTNTNINTLKMKENTKTNIDAKKTLPKKKKDILFESDEEKSSDEESSRKTKTTKPKLNKSSKNNSKLKSSKGIKLNDKKNKDYVSSSSVSFG